jgi:hypothetical protein
MLLSQAQLRKLRPKAADAEASDAAAAADADDGAQLRERLAIQSASQRKRFTLALRALRADVDALAFISPRWFEAAPAEAAAEAAGAAAAALPLPELEVTVLQQPRVRVTAAGYGRHSLTLELTDKEWKAMRVAASAARGERVAAEARDAAEAVGSALVAKELARVQALLELSDEVRARDAAPRRAAPIPRARDERRTADARAQRERLTRARALPPNPPTRGLVPAPRPRTRHRARRRAANAQARARGLRARALGPAHARREARDGRARRQGAARRPGAHRAPLAEGLEVGQLLRRLRRAGRRRRDGQRADRPLMGARAL